MPLSDSPHALLLQELQLTPGLGVSGAMPNNTSKEPEGKRSADLKAIIVRCSPSGASNEKCNWQFVSKWCKFDRIR